MTKYILFDLDGTLLPMDQEDFTKAYFKALSAAMYPHGYEPQLLMKAVWNGMKAMVENNGERTNEEAFWDSFRKDYGEKAVNDKPEFDKFYKTGFNETRSVCGFNPKAKETINMIKKLNIKTAVATLPAFPSQAIASRIEWSGCLVDDFEFYTSYESCSYCKPNIGYYKEILSRLNCNAEDCLMVGNNVDEDMIAEKVGFKVFLLTDCLINEHNKDISLFPNGSFDELQEYILKSNTDY